MSKSEVATSVDYQILSLSLDCLAVYNLSDRSPLLQKLGHFLQTMSRDKLPLGEKIKAYADVYRCFIRTGSKATWCDCLIEGLLRDVNPFTEASARQPTGPARERLTNLIPAILEDLNTLQAMAALQASDIKEDLRRAAIAGEEEALLAVIGKLPEWPSCSEHKPTAAGDRARREFRLPHSAAALYDRLKQSLTVENGWSDRLPDLADFHRHNGCGELAFHHMFIWEGDLLKPVQEPDRVSLDDLVDYTGLIEEARANTAAFLAGQPAENVLFSGDRGTGKSSTVKALANTYHSAGLRLLEVTRQAIHTLPDLFKKLAPLTLKFIIFLDDLSFESANEDYNKLKSLLQGGSSRQPDNVLIYVTTNRRHLLVERHADTGAERFESDARQERLSLVERFGLILNFRTPLQKSYLDIVKKLAVKNGLLTKPADWASLQEQSLSFAARQSSRSPRTAELFIRRMLGQAPNEAPPEQTDGGPKSAHQLTGSDRNSLDHL